MRRIGVFGGTFDPIHEAHLRIAHAALLQENLDVVLFVVSARPPHKMNGAVALAEDRFALVEAALSGEQKFIASQIELDRDGPSYTVDTLAMLKQKEPDAELWLILGMDSLADFSHWRDPQGILSMAHLLVIRRPGAYRISPELEGRYELLDFDETALSSTEVRRRIARGEPLDTIIPTSVQQLIQERGIYRDYVDD